MADPTDILLKLKTEADTSGVEKTRDALDDLNDAQKKSAEGSKDVSNEAGKANPQLSQLVNLQRAQIAQQLAQQIQNIGTAIRGVANDFKESDKEFSDTLSNTAMGLDSLSGALSGAAQGFAVGGPFGAAIGGTVGLLSGPLKRAYEEMITDIQKASAAKMREAEMERQLIVARAEHAKNLKISDIRKTYEEEVSLLREQLGLLRDINEVRAAQGNTELSGAQAAVTNAETNGGNVGDAKAKLLGVEYGNQLDLLDSKLAEYQAAAAVAADTLSRAKESFDGIKGITDRDEQAFKDAATAVQNAEKAANLATSQLDKQTALYEEGRKQAANEFASKFATLRKDSMDAVTKGAAETLAAVQQQAAESGGNLSVQTRTSMQALEKILADGVVKPEEMTRLTDAMVRIRNSREVADKEILKGLESLYNSTSTVLASLPQLISRIERLEGMNLQ